MSERLTDAIIWLHETATGLAMLFVMVVGTLGIVLAVAFFVSALFSAR